MNPNFLSFPTPLVDDKAPAIRKPVNFAGTGTTESSNTDSPFLMGRQYLFTVGPVAVRVVFSKTGGQANVVSSTNSLILPANSWCIFTTIEHDEEGWGSQFVYVEAADGTSAYLASAVCVR